MCKLKRNHAYRAQAQGQWGSPEPNAVTCQQRCDRDYWVELQEKLCQYYFTHLIKCAAAEFALSYTEAVVVCHSTTTSQS